MPEPETRRSLDEKQRCCGRKPLAYKRPPHFFCIRCDRAYNLETGIQIENWAYRALEDGTFEPTSQYVGCS